MFCCANFCVRGLIGDHATAAALDSHLPLTQIHLISHFPPRRFTSSNSPLPRRFTSILTENVGQMTVIYLGTDSGSVEKLSLTPRSNKVALLSEFIVADAHTPVLSVTFANNEVGGGVVEGEGRRGDGRRGDGRVLVERGVVKWLEGGIVVVKGVVITVHVVSRDILSVRFSSC